VVTEDYPWKGFTGSLQPRHWHTPESLGTLPWCEQGNCGWNEPGENPGNQALNMSAIDSNQREKIYIEKENSKS